MEIEERFWSKVDKTGDCWVWTGGKNENGYGVYHTITYNKIFNSPYTHRFSYFLANGTYDRKLDVCHKCDNPSCVNPNHLFLGTRSDNMKDCYAKGRSALPDRSGEQINTAKLDWNKVREIRQRYTEGGITLEELGRQYGVTKSTVGRIIKEIIWKEK